MKLRCYSNIFCRVSENFIRGLFSDSPRFTSTVLNQWHLIGAVCLERKPIISQPLTPLEQRYFKYLQKLELEKSLLSDHEKKFINDLKTAEKLKKGLLDDSDAILGQTAQDFEDASLEEFNKFKPRSRITDADSNNDQRSLERRLDSSLVLAISMKLGNDLRWMLPQAIHKDGETLRQTAERALHLICPSLSNVQYFGNAPVGYYKYKYPKAARGDGIFGAKVFFFKAHLVGRKLESPAIQHSDNVLDHLWLTHAELPDFMQINYSKCVLSFLYPDVINVDDIQPQPDSTEDHEPIKSSAKN